MATWHEHNSILPAAGAPEETKEEESEVEVMEGDGGIDGWVRWAQADPPRYEPWGADDGGDGGGADDGGDGGADDLAGHHEGDAADPATDAAEPGSAAEPGAGSAPAEHGGGDAAGADGAEATPAPPWRGGTWKAGKWKAGKWKGNGKGSNNGKNKKSKGGGKGWGNRGGRGRNETAKGKGNKRWHDDGAHQGGGTESPLAYYSHLASCNSRQSCFSSGIST